MLQARGIKRTNWTAPKQETEMTKRLEELVTMTATMSVMELDNLSPEVFTTPFLVDERELDDYAEVLGITRGELLQKLDDDPREQSRFEAVCFAMRRAEEQRG
jgi:hypothetical protein